MTQNQRYASICRVFRNVEEKLREYPKIVEIFQNCYLNTLDATVKSMDDGTTYVITGDIPAMWLRDSTAQLRPFLPVAEQEPALQEILAGLSRRQFQYIQTDPYSNAFNEADNGNCWEHDITEQNGWVWERKYEVDSLCYPLQFAYLLWKNTGCREHPDSSFQAGAGKILQVFRTEQYHEERSPYSFVRQNTYFKDTLSRDGKGALVKSGIGMTWSGFRPSDDACMYGYLVPSNMFAVVALGYLEEMAGSILKDWEMQKEAADLKEQIYQGIETCGIVKTEEFGEVYACETDGYGQYNLMDDVNVPSLLSMAPALSAVMYAMNRLIQGTERSGFADYRKGYCSDFGQKMQLGAGQLTAVLLCWTNIEFFTLQVRILPLAIIFILMFAAALLVTPNLYLLASRYEMENMQIVKTAVTLLIARPVSTLGNLAAFAILLAAFEISAGTTVLFMGSVYGFLIMFMNQSIMQKLESRN